MTPRILRYALSNAQTAASRRLGQDQRARHAVAVKRGHYEQAARLAPRALAALYTLPEGLDYTGLYCPSTGVLIIPTGPTRPGGRSEAIPALRLDWLADPGMVTRAHAAAVEREARGEEPSAVATCWRTVSGQLRALDLLLSTAAWLAGAAPAAVVTLPDGRTLRHARRERPWYAPEEVARVLPAAAALACTPRWDGGWEPYRMLAFTLAKGWRESHGRPHGCEERIGWALHAAERAQVETRREDDRIAAAK